MSKAEDPSLSRVTCLLCHDGCPRILICWMVFLLFAVPPSCWAVETNKTHRVALASFTSDDSYVRSLLACRDFTALLQVKLADVPQVVWVERQEIIQVMNELNMDQMGLLDGAASLRLGKWLRADLLVIGNFKRDRSRRVLHLEIVEVDHADILAEHTVSIDGDPRDPVTVRSTDVEAAADAVRDSLRRARLRLGQYQGSQVLAPLFFRNVDPSPRLDSFGSELLTACMEQDSLSNGLRVLRFPRPLNARGEAELGLRGLAAADKSASESLADGYVWGGYRELKSDGQPFEDVTIELNINFWTGDGEVRQNVVSGRVGQRQALARKVAGETLALLRQTNGKRHSPSARASMAKWLLDRAAALRETLRSFATKQGQFLETAEGRNLSRQLVDTLELACFFAPENRQAQWDRIQARWAGYPYGDSSFFEFWQQLTDLNDFLALFPARVDVPADRLLLQNRLDATEFLGRQLQYPENLPIDARENIVADWKHELELRITQYRAELQQLHERDAVIAPETEPAVKRNFAPSNSPAHISWPKPGRATDVTNTRGANPPVQIHPVIRTVPVPGRCAYIVNAMADVDHTLWFSADALEAPRLDPRIHKRQSVLFRYLPAFDTCENITERIGPHSQITALLPDSDKLWMTLLFDGVWTISPATLEVTKFGVQNGLVSPNMSAVTHWTTNLLFGGVRENRALFAFLNPGSTNWRRLDFALPLVRGPSGMDRYRGMQTPSCELRRLLCLEHWALAGPNPWTVIDLSSGTGQALPDLLGIHAEPSLTKAHPYSVSLNDFSRTACCCAAATEGFWIATSKRLFFLKPGFEASVQGALPFDVPNAIAFDDEFLWVATAAEGDPDVESLTPSLLSSMFSKYEKESSRIAIFHVPSRKWLSYFVVPGHVSDICCAQRSVYLGCNLSRTPVLEVDKGSVLESHPAQ